MCVVCGDADLKPTALLGSPNPVAAAAAAWQIVVVRSLLQLVGLLTSTGPLEVA